MQKIKIFVLLFVINLYAFQGQGECKDILADYAILNGKSIYVPPGLNGKCVIKNERDIPFILKNAGYNYKERDRSLDITAIVPWTPKAWTPKEKRYRVNFAFINVSSAIDCGLTLDDVLFSFENLHGQFSLAGSLGCPALDRDGSFTLSVNANVVDQWSYNHGTEISRAVSQITSATGAVTTEYKYITSGLELSLIQFENYVQYKLRYTSSSGSVTTSQGALVPIVIADVEELVKTKRKLWIIPLGWSEEVQKYRLVLQFIEDLPLNVK